MPRTDFDAEDRATLTRWLSWLGRIEEMPEDEKNFLLGMLGGALMRRMGLSAADLAPQEPGTPAMVYLGKGNRRKRFACEDCGANVFTRRGDLYTCNGCQSEYLGAG